MMKLTSPLSHLYKTEQIYEFLRGKLPLPRYVEGSYFVSQECAEAVAMMSLHEQAEVAYDAIYRVHEEVRKSLPAQKKLLDENCRYSTNAFLEVPLAGYEVFGTLAHMIAPYLQVAGFELDKTFSIFSYASQARVIELIDLEHLPLLTNIYLEKRREFIEQHNIADKGDLRDYIAERSHDVFGVIYGTPDCTPEHQRVRRQISKQMYHDGEESIVYAYGVARCTIRANGGGTPISGW